MFTECINEFLPLADGLKSFPNHSFGCSFLGLFPAFLPFFHQKRHLTDVGSPVLLFQGSQKVSCPYSPNSLFGFGRDGILDSWGMPGSWRCFFGNPLRHYNESKAPGSRERDESFPLIFICTPGRETLSEVSPGGSSLCTPSLLVCCLCPGH